MRDRLVDFITSSSPSLSFLACPSLHRKHFVSLHEQNILFHLASFLSQLLFPCTPYSRSIMLGSPCNNENESFRTDPVNQEQRTAYWQTVLIDPAPKSLRYLPVSSTEGQSSTVSSSTLSPCILASSSSPLSVPVLVRSLPPVIHSSTSRDKRRTRYPCKNAGCRQTFAHRSSRSRHFSKFHKNR